MKKLTLTLLIILSIGFGVNQHNTQAVIINDYDSKYELKEGCNRPNMDYCIDNSLTSGLAENETTMFYMYTDEDGHWFIDPLAGEEENLIYVGLSDLYVDTFELYAGKRFVGSFEDSALWELIGLEEVEFVESELEIN